MCVHLSVLKTPEFMNDIKLNLCNNVCSTFLSSDFAAKKDSLALPTDSQNERHHSVPEMRNLIKGSAGRVRRSTRWTLVANNVKVIN